MPDIATSDVTYTLLRSDIEDKYRKTVVSVAFGDGALTYPAGGVPLESDKMGAPNEVRSVSLHDAASSNGFVYKYDSANNKLRIYQGDNDGGADGPLVELAGGVATPAAATLELQVEGW